MPSPDIKSRYAQAEKLLNENMMRAVKNSRIIPQWISNTAFCYELETPDGVQHLCYDLESDKTTAFMDDGPTRENPFAGRGCVVSSDGRCGIFVRDHNLWLATADSEAERPLTTDGEAYFAYGKPPEAGGTNILYRTLGMSPPPHGIAWSPDGRKILITRRDERDCGTFGFLEPAPLDGSLRQRHHIVKYPLMTEGSLPVECAVIDSGTGEKTVLQFPPGILPYDTLQSVPHVLGWGEGERSLVMLAADDCAKEWNVLEFDCETGVARLILSERAETFFSSNPAIYSKPNARLLCGGRELLWFSERSGWGHLYRYDVKSGELLNAVTGGEWAVRDVLGIDEVRRTIIFAAGGREPDCNPYYRLIYAVGFDGEGLRLLTPELADHEYNNMPDDRPLGCAAARLPYFSPDYRHFVDSYSTATEPPVNVLRRISDGAVIKELARADISELLRAGWSAPEAVCVKSADGAGDLYGYVYHPPGFDPSSKYPVINAIYGGPMLISTAFGFVETKGSRMTAVVGRYDLSAYAQLGFVVVAIEGRGSPGRSKAFHDAAYQNPSVSLDDNVAALKALAAARPYMDLSRAGVFGGSYGGYIATRAMLAYPDFYKAGVSVVGVNSFARLPHSLLSMYFGKPKYEDSGASDIPANYQCGENAGLAGSLRGRLMLCAGGLDENAPWQQFAIMAEALVKANKRFDILCIPGGNHAISANLYLRKRRMDYFVQHLLNEEPPEDHVFQLP